MDVGTSYAAVTKFENVKFSSKIFELLFDRLVIWNYNELEVKLIIILIAALKLRYGKLLLSKLKHRTPRTNSELKSYEIVCKLFSKIKFTQSNKGNIYFSAF